MKELLETLSQLEHDQWVTWANSLMEKEQLSEERLKRWKKLSCPYDALSEEEKNQDRAWARFIIEALLNYIKEYPEHFQGLILKNELKIDLERCLAGEQTK